MTRTAAFRLLILLAPFALHAQDRLPIIDMHLHALAADEQGPPPVAMCTPIDPMPAWDPARPYAERFMQTMKSDPPCDDPVWSPTTDSELMAQTFAELERLNVYGVVSGDRDHVATWMAADSDRLIPGIRLNVATNPELTPDLLRTLIESGEVQVLGEVTNQYAGIAPDDERMEPYWALAEELDIPVGIHVGTGPPGVAYLGSSGYRARLHSALTMEEVLIAHPRLRVYLMHAGYPMLDDLLAVMYAHPQVYAGIGVIVYTQPRAAFYRYLRGIVEAGFGDRILFGTDQMVWPGVIERSIRVIEEAPFLTELQKRDILYNNAARFLRLSEEEIARHHGGKSLNLSHPD
ncbi:MAG: amidohydrolase family protein [Saprospiraceae bacterium]|nr:amidohydrolase family protein [Saprospiraceae bacterium]